MWRPAHFCAAFLIVLVGRWFLLQPYDEAHVDDEPTPPDPVEAPVLPAESGSRAQRGRPAASCERIRQDIERSIVQLERALQRLQERQELLVGSPLPWPDTKPPEEREADLAPFLVQATQLTEIPGLTLMDLSCEEFPCIATYEVLDDDFPLGTNTEYMTEIAEATERAGVPLEHAPGYVWRRDYPGNHIIVAALPDRRLSGDEWFHVEQRIQDVVVRYEQR